MFGLPGVQRVGGGVERTEGNKGKGQSRMVLISNSEVFAPDTEARQAQILG